MTFIHGNLKDVLLNIQAALVRTMKVNASWLVYFKAVPLTFNNWKKDWSNMTEQNDDRICMNSFKMFILQFSSTSAWLLYDHSPLYVLYKEHYVSRPHYRLECLPKPVHHCVGSAQQSSSGLLCASNTAADWIKHKNSE